MIDRFTLTSVKLSKSCSMILNENILLLESNSIILASLDKKDSVVVIMMCVLQESVVGWFHTFCSFYTLNLRLTSFNAGSLVYCIIHILMIHNSIFRLKRNIIFLINNSAIEMCLSMINKLNQNDDKTELF